jgi:hypothetical protein
VRTLDEESRAVTSMGAPLPAAAAPPPTACEDALVRRIFDGGVDKSSVLLFSRVQLPRHFQVLGVVPSDKVSVESLAKVASAGARVPVDAVKSLTLNMFNLSDVELMFLIEAMFNEFKLIEKFNVPIEKFRAFLIAVRNSYRRFVKIFSILFFNFQFFRAVPV